MHVSVVITPWSAVPLVELIVTQLPKNISCFYTPKLEDVIKMDLQEVGLGGHGLD
jgi:hypothetical protein